MSERIIDTATMEYTGEEIIRCRDCMHYQSVPYYDGTVHTKCDGVFAFVETRPDGFCSWAKRRES